MSDNYEERVRKGIDDLAKVDPEFAAINREEMIREAAAGLRKAETAWGGPASPGPAILELVKAPFTGRLNGIEVERGLWPWGLILIRGMGAIFGPIFGLIQWVAFWNLSRRGLDARLTDSGVETFSKRKGHVAKYSWSEISGLRKILEPPFQYWELVLARGVAVPLHMADLDPAPFHTHGVAVQATAKFRHEYEHDG
jgi:hypothetical protein